MHTPSTRILSALAYDRGEEYDPADPIAADLLETLSLVDHARPVIGETARTSGPAGAAASASS
ncbi:MAG: hypothetical protein ACLQA5_21460 [Solirubrobacteraceae bacterium]